MWEDDQCGSIEEKGCAKARKEGGHKIIIVDDCYITGLDVRQGHGSSMAVTPLPLIASEYYTIFSTVPASAQGLN